MAIDLPIRMPLPATGASQESHHGGRHQSLFWDLLCDFALHEALGRSERKFTDEKVRKIVELKRKVCTEDLVHEAGTRTSNM